MKRTLRLSLLAAVSCCLVLAGPGVGWTLFAYPTGVPIDRVIANVEARLQQDPGDVDALYTLARAHYLAFVNKSAVVPGYIGRNGGLANGVPIAPRWMTESSRSGGVFLRAARRARAIEEVLAERGVASLDDLEEAEIREFNQLVAERHQQLRAVDWRPDELDTRQVLGHVQKALDAFEAAIEASPDSGLYHLGLGSLYEQYVRFRESQAPRPAKAGSCGTGSSRSPPRSDQIRATSKQTGCSAWGPTSTDWRGCRRIGPSHRSFFRSRPLRGSPC